MKQNTLIRVLFGFSFLFFAESCGLDIKEDFSNYPWVKEGNILTYDLVVSNSRLEEKLRIEILEDPGIRDNLTFRKYYESFDLDTPLIGATFFLMHHVYRMSDGLHTTTCNGCVNPCLSVFNFLQVPARPILNQEIPEYSCDHSIFKSDFVISIDSLITVPHGTYETFVIQDTLMNTYSFWNEKIGLIRIDIPI